MSVITIVLEEPRLGAGSQQPVSDVVVSSVLVVDAERFLPLFLRLKNLLSLLSLLFHFSEQLMATPIPAKRMAIGTMMRYAISLEELSSAVTGGIASRRVYDVNCCNAEYKDKGDE